MKVRDLITIAIRIIAVYYLVYTVSQLVLFASYSAIESSKHDIGLITSLILQVIFWIAALNFAPSLGKALIKDPNDILIGMPESINTRTIYSFAFVLVGTVFTFIGTATLLDMGITALQEMVSINNDHDAHYSSTSMVLIQFFSGILLLTNHDRISKWLSRQSHPE